ncbi:hypothetical protein [Sphaerimonospora thailandensis]|uniref:Uncharacterized protein n=1 Tax=Sphaerimonospora thailandensis TaxID=795644 RepID=A0A8J3VZ26_9ACTN|nr:hypothetical protein [Sphaerimonospora thailandensis]GIH69603.1 hypothetical protein Mth01_18560 [Sphaerimonospora thailandensis]
MGWFSDLLLPGRLRTGPTVLLSTRPDPKALLAIARLADPEAVFDGDDILAGSSRILAAIELTGAILAKLGLQGEERLWACRVTAEGPLPVDFFDKSLAEGIAFRLGGWSLCQGEPTDPTESERRDPVVYLPAAPSPEETIEILRELVSPVESLDVDRWPDGELVDGIVRVPMGQGAITDVYVGADTVVTIEEGRGIPPAARVRWPYLTEIVIAKISPLASPDANEPTGAVDDGSDAETRDDGEVQGGIPADEQALATRAEVALALAQRLRGIAADEGGFQLVEPADILPGRHT